MRKFFAVLGVLTIFFAITTLNQMSLREFLTGLIFFAVVGLLVLAMPFFLYKAVKSGIRLAEKTERQAPCAGCRCGKHLHSGPGQSCSACSCPGFIEQGLMEDAPTKIPTVVWVQLARLFLRK
jgi:hypothetical protein